MVSCLFEPHAVDAGGHVVHFYECDADLVAHAGDYLRDAARLGEVAIVIATRAHRDAFESRLRDTTAGGVVWLDAVTTLSRITRTRRIDRDAFFDVVGSVVRAEAAASGRPVRAYGGMVGLLWDAGDVTGAIELETLWNELATEVRFSLYCGYRSESVRGHDHADALAQVRHLHSAVLPPPPGETTQRFPADATAPAAARRLLRDALKRPGHHAHLLDDAQIVITELAANAVKHARTPFSVSIHTTRSRVRIEVRDGSRLLPAVRDDSSTRPAGRGMRLVTALATEWGVEPAPDGKVVWAELGR